MPHIEIPNGLAGVSGLLAAYPDTGTPLRALAEALLRGPSSLTPGERELIATAVSAGNQCKFCSKAHAAVARAYLNEAPGGVVDAILAREANPAVSPKMAALLNIAEKVRRSGREVTPEDIAQARAQGADDKAIHDTALIAATFCLFNRYVDGLGTQEPDDPRIYEAMGIRLSTQGYHSGPQSAATNPDVKKARELAQSAPK
jgi:uncharacterized peroxidase-related enzyme